MSVTYLSCTWDLCGPLFASSMEMCSNSAWLRLSVDEFSSTIVQSPSTTELVSVKSVAEPTLYSSTRGMRRVCEWRRTKSETKGQWTQAAWVVIPLLVSRDRNASCV